MTDPSVNPLVIAVFRLYGEDGVIRLDKAFREAEKTHPDREATLEEIQATVDATLGDGAHRRIEQCCDEILMDALLQIEKAFADE